MQNDTATAGEAEHPGGLSPLALAQAEFDPEVVYLDTASLGLPPRRSLEALNAALEDWRTGRAAPPAYDAPLAASRASYARLVGVDPSWVTVGSQVSAFTGLIAANLPDGSQVLTAEGEFTSVVFPFHAQARRGVEVREVPLERLAEEVTSRTALVAVAAVQSADGRVADLDALTSACEATGTRVLLDVTQAVGWLPVDASRFAYTTCGGYKWLLGARGTAYSTVQPALADGIIPHGACWYAGGERWDSLYGGPLRLASDARRFDLSPVWHAWVGQEPALELIEGIGTQALHEHNLGLANRFRTSVGLPAGDSAIVSVAVDDSTHGLLKRAGVVGSVRAGRLRLAFHLYNTEADADRAAEVLDGHLDEAAEDGARS
ncbi:Selenocysteine lyase/Cysteine desulfurase [Streptomyces sp. WMMB 714]|uniref:aminotransferase class V-fold PLP-dependent enzyme n=1 Tax=Streptomyces sp. WMMB 714 TaxID=1286822 RepID=UPI0005F83BB8|nr:aminotransferase class V-fold PLP-dependent enzyme [Streptomyces sp. WMMB 714]SCK50514.1 Selenocysteine lyase/Cysteine desulfurase [Streptomyces sp. WMMB 714]